jgi:Anion-transporting ATPase
MFKNEYDVYVFDTAPTANARRLLGMSKVYSLWVNKMLKSREEARTLREMLSFTKKKETDPLMEYLVTFRDRMEHARKLLTDPALTAFFFVTLAEALPIAVVMRFIQWFKDFGIPVGGVLVKMVIDQKAVGADAAEFVKNRVATQQEHKQTIWRESTTASARSCRCSRPRCAACHCSSACATLFPSALDPRNRPRRPSLAGLGDPISGAVDGEAKDVAASDGNGPSLKIFNLITISCFFEIWPDD